MKVIWIIGGIVILSIFLIATGVLKITTTTTKNEPTIIDGADAQIKQDRKPGIPAATFSDAVIQQCYYEALKRTQNNCGAPLPNICQGILQYPQLYQQSHINQVWPFELGYYSDVNKTGVPGGLFNTYSFV